jgi:dihydrofolate reductase
MGKIILGMTMSLDGFIHDGNGSIARLYPDLDTLPDLEVMRESILSTGAVVMERRSYEMGDPDSYADHYEYQVPIFVLTRSVPKKWPKQTSKITFNFVSDGVEKAVELARAAAGDRNVTIIGGASVARQCIKTGLADEMHIDIMPLLLCNGLRLFDELGETPIALERIAVIQTSTRTHLQFRIVH